MGKSKGLEKPKKETGDYIMVCPKCGSTNISPHGKEPGVYNEEMAAAFGEHVCDDCEYHGTFFPMIKVDKLKSFQKLFKKHGKSKQS